MAASGPAYRTIGEVAELVGVPQHVLRFWETRFPQIQPMKRGGNRRYYRPQDVELLTTINRMLYVDGYTIKGVQKLLEGGGKLAGASSGEAPVFAAPSTAAAPSANPMLAALSAIRTDLAAALASARAV